MNDDAVQSEIPAWIGGTGQYAVIHVQYEPGGEAWPVVQRVPGGWQSGVHHYPDDAVLDVRPLTLVDPGDTRSIVQRVTEHLLTHAIAGNGDGTAGRCDERVALVERLRTIVEWVSERDHGRAVELDAVVHELERVGL